MKFIGLATLIYFVVYKVDANSTISEITFSPSKEIDISSGPVSVILSFEFTIESASAINVIGLWYDGGCDLETFICLSDAGFVAVNREEIPKLFGPGPYEESEEKCASLYSCELQTPPPEGKYYFCDIPAGKMAVRIEYSLQSLTSATNVWRAALMNVNGSLVAISNITTPPAITTVGVLTRNLTIRTSTSPDGSIIMNFKCSIGPVIPDIELILTLPPSAETEPAKGNNSVSVQIPFNDNLGGATITCEAYIAHPRPIVLLETKVVDYSPIYLNDPFTTVCQYPCQVNLLCSQHLVAYPEAAVTFWWKSNTVGIRNSSVVLINETVTIECTATNLLGNATQTIFASITRAPCQPAIISNLAFLGVIAALSAALLVSIGMSIYIHFKARKLNQQFSSLENRPIMHPVDDESVSVQGSYGGTNDCRESPRKIETVSANNKLSY